MIRTVIVSRKSLLVALISISAALVFAAVGVVGAASASAATIAVDSGADAVSGAGACTLREAVIAANTDTATGGCPAGSGADTIVIGVPKVTLTRPGAREDSGFSGDLDVSSVLTIAGAGAGSTTIDGGGLDRVLDVHAGATVTVRDLKITGGQTPDGANAAVTGKSVAGTVVAPDGAPGQSGGGIANAGVLTLLRVTLSANHTGRGGNGGLAVGADSMTGTGTGAVGGSGGAGGDGGGVFNSGSLVVQDSTITGNSTGSGGGGLAGIAGQGGPLAAGGKGRGGDGGGGGSGGGLATVGQATVTGTDFSANTTGAGGSGGIGEGGLGGPSSGDGGAGGAGSGGQGGRGGSGGGAAVLANVLTLDDSLARNNASAVGGAGGAGEGGGGANGSGAGNGGPGGSGSGGRGGDGGIGGGVANLAGAGGTLVADSDTIATNSAGGGGEGGIGAGATAGNGGFASDGGDGDGGDGGEGGLGGGLGRFGTVTQSTITGNVASAPGGAGGGAIAGSGGMGSAHDGAAGTRTLGFTGPSAGIGGVFLMVVRDSILSANLPVSCSNTDGANDIEFPGTSCPGATHADPGLGLLADHGGPTPTYALSPGSPAVDHVPSAGAGCTPTDQRGVTRPQGAACDAGAYELAPPAVTTGTPAPDATTATITGTVNPHLRAASARFEFGTTTAYGSATVDETAGAGNADATVSATLTGLRPATTYHVRLVATNADGTTQGADVSFTTQPVPQAGRTTTTTAPPPPPSRAPVLSKLTLKPATFRVAPAKHPRRDGTEISYVDSRAGTTAFSVQQRLTGVLNGARCVAPPATRAHHGTPKHCTRYVLLAGGFSHTDRAGTNRLRFTGVLGHKRLARGTYRLRARPRSGTLSGKLVSKAFHIA
jgi:CSLREA domain-containing protein